MMEGRLCKRTVDKVIDECFWEGFQSGLVSGLVGGLEYASTSGLYQYNGVRKIAERAGYDEAQRLLNEAVERRQGPGRSLPGGYKYQVPAKVVAECYGEARIGHKLGQK